MRPINNTLVIDKEAPRWLYEVLRRLGNQVAHQNHQLSAVERGEAPSGGGTSLIGTNDHGELSGLSPDDDHDQYALLRGRVGGQILNGSIDISTSSSSYPWTSAGTTLITAEDTTLAGSWNRVINNNVAVDTIVFLSLATHSPGAGYGAGSTNYHTSVTDSQSNVWTKLGEHTTSYFAGTEEQTVSIWYSLITTAMTTGASDSLTFNFSNNFAMKAVESHQFLMTAGLTLTVLGSTTGGNVDSDPPPLTLSGLTSREYLFIRACAIHGTDDSHTEEYTPSSGYTPFTTNHADSTTLAVVGGNRGIAARGEFIIATATASTSDPTVSALTFADDSSLMIAIAVGSAAEGDLTLQSIDHDEAAKITLHNSTITMNFDYLNFRAEGSGTTQSYIRGSDGAFVGELILGTEATSDPGAGNYLTLLGFNNPPIAGTTNITDRSAEAVISKDFTIYADNLIVVERNTSYGVANGFSVATGLGFANVANVGTVTITGSSSASGALLTIDHSGAGLAEKDLIIKKRASQSGNMTEWQNDAGTAMSFIRASDGAFVGPIVVSGTDTHIDNVFSILDNSDNTKIAQFQCSSITTGTTRTYTLPDASGTVILSTGPANTAQVIGTYAPSGTDAADDLAITGRLFIGASGSWTAGQNFRSVATTTSTTGTINSHQLGMTVNSSGAVGVLTVRGLLASVSGGSSITGGTPSIHGCNFTVNPSFGAGVTASEVVAFDMASRMTSLGAGSTLNFLCGIRTVANGVSTNIGDTYSLTDIIGIRATISSGSGKTDTMSGIDLYIDTANKIHGFNSTAAAINLSNFGDLATTWASNSYACTVTNGSNILTAVTNVANLHTGQLVTKASIPAGTYITAINVGAGTVTLNNNATANDTSVNVSGTTQYWSGIYYNGTLPISGEVVNARILDLHSTTPSQIAGNVYFAPSAASLYLVPTARVHIGASTTAAGSAPLKFVSGALMTTAEAGAFEFVTDDLYFTITTGAARKGIILNDGTNLTSGRVPFATTNGRLTDDADFTFATDTLTVTKIAATTFTGNITLNDIDLVLGTTTGTKFGTATSQKLGFWNATPIVQPTTAIAAATFVANTSGIADDTATFDGYTIGQIVKALRNTGLLQ